MDNEKSVIGLKCECLITDIYSQDGTVKAVPIDDEIRIRAGNEVVDYALKKGIEKGFITKPQ